MLIVELVACFDISVYNSTPLPVNTSSNILLFKQYLVLAEYHHDIGRPQT